MKLKNIERNWPAICGGAAILIVTLPLFFCRPFYRDWSNHLWFIQYFAEYFQANHWFPSLVNTSDLVGIPNALFYGYLFYPTMGLIASFTNAEFAVRIVAIFFFTIQFVLYFNILEDYSDNAYFSFVVAVSIIWSIYPLTNLYHRSALTEFFAVSSLYTTIPLLFRTFTEKNKKRVVYASFATMFLSFAVGSHPITGMLGGGFLILTIPLWFIIFAAKRVIRSFIVFIPFAVLLGLSIAPWIYVTLSMYADLNIVGRASTITYIEGIDEPYIRLFPIPFDLRVYQGNVTELSPLKSTPYLDAQASLPLLFLFLGSSIFASRYLAGRQRNKVICVALIWFFMFCLVFYVSVSPTSPIYLPAIAGMIQFAYRLTSYINMSLMIGIISILYIMKNNRDILGHFTFPDFMRHIITFCLVAALLSVLIKNTEAFISIYRLNEHHDKTYIEKVERLPRFAGRFVNDYMTPRYYNTLTPRYYETLRKPKLYRRFFFMNVDESFGTVKKISKAYNFSDDSIVILNVFAMKWNKILINGEPPERERLFRLSSEIAVLVPAGSGTITYLSDIPTWWKWMHRIGQITWFFWLFTNLVLVGVQMVKQVQARTS